VQASHSAEALEIGWLSDRAQTFNRDGWRKCCVHTRRDVRSARKIGEI